MRGEAGDEHREEVDLSRRQAAGPGRHHALPAAMDRGKFTLYNVAGAVIWVVGITAAGYFFGNIPWVQNNLQIIIWSLILIPGVLALWGVWKASRNKKDGHA